MLYHMQEDMHNNSKKIKVVFRPSLGTYCRTYYKQLLAILLPMLHQRCFLQHLLHCTSVGHLHKILLNSYNNYAKLINKFVFSQLTNIDGRASVERRLKNMSGHQRSKASEACLPFHCIKRIESCH